VTQVDDPGGPFDDFWYVESYKVYIDRALLVNRKFYPGGEIYDINQDTEKHRNSVNTLLRAVQAHEKLHSEQFREHLGKLDPASTVENYISTDADMLRVITDQACKEADDNLLKSASEREVHIRLRGLGFAHGGELWDGSGNPPYVIDSFADLGDVEKE
jgi:hypothetical protein